MQNNDFRAKQFMPFDSLKGFYDLIKNQENCSKSKISLLDDYNDYLDEQLKKIKKGDNISVEHYYNEDYIQTNGIIKKIDTIDRCIYVLDSKILLDDIIKIKLI